MASDSGISGTAVFVTLVGVVFAYAGLKNHTISDSIRSFLRGEVPTDTAAPGVGGTGPGAPTPSGASGSHYQTIIESLYRGGFTDAGVAGAAGNISVETGGTFSPTAYNASEGAIGICQWELGRRVALQAYAATRGMSESDIEAQLGYMWVELSSGFAHVRIQGMAATDPAHFAAVWDAEYEISAGTSRAERISRAEQIYQSLTSAKHRVA